MSIILLMIANLLFWGAILLAGGVIKLLTFGALRRRVILALAGLAERWAAGNERIFDAHLDTRWIIEGADDFRRDARYLVVSNHTSWLDIFALLRTFRGRAPFFRFFIKQGLIWLPIIGQACWALEFPFMRRYTPEYLKQHPEKRGRDLETTRIACRRYRRIPVTILNFVEGTRFTRNKHEDQQSPYRHLLRPRIGGIGFVLASLGDQLDAIYDVTIVYPRRDVTLWDFVTNKVPWIVVHVRRVEVPPQLRSEAVSDAGPAREQLKAWIDQTWRDKDALISQIVEDRRERLSPDS